MTSEKEILPQNDNLGHWVQTDREAHEAWAILMRKSPAAAELLHLLVARMGQHNAVVISQATLAELMKRNKRTVSRAVKQLVEGRWVEVRQIGQRGSVNAYVINDRVAWNGKRENMRYSLFSAHVILSETEQPDRDTLNNADPLRSIPSMYPGERQLPSGDGIPPPSQPELPSIEPDLPSKKR